MTRQEPQPLSKKQLGLGAAIALVLTCAGLWWGAPSQLSTTPIETQPLNRRVAERGQVNIIDKNQKSLAFNEESATAGGIIYLNNTKKRREPVTFDFDTHTLKGLPINVTIVNSKIRSNKLPRGQRQDPNKIVLPDLFAAHHLNQPSKAPDLDEPSNTDYQSDLPSLTSSRHSYPTAKKTTHSHSNSTHYTPNSKLQTSHSKLQTPNSNYELRIPNYELSQSWSANRAHTVFVYTDTGIDIAGLCTQISPELSVSSTTSAQMRNIIFSAGSTDFADLGISLIPFKSPRSPILASQPPDPGSVLATVGLPTNAKTFAQVMVADSIYSGLFTLICPIRASFKAAPLFNNHSELAGIVLGTLPSYRGHNHFIGTDTSMLQSWIQGDFATGNDSLFNIEFQVCDQLDKALNRLKVPKTSTQPDQLSPIVIPGKKLGSCYLGMTKNDIDIILGPGKRSNYDLLGNPIDSNAELMSYYHYLEYDIDCNFYNDRLVAIETSNPRFHTRKGLAVGARFQRQHALHEMSGRSCSGYTAQNCPLMVMNGLEAELDSKGNVRLLRVTL